MDSFNIGKHSVKYYDNPRDVPIERLFKFQQQLLQDWGIGSTMEDVSRHLMKLFSFLQDEDLESSTKEVENLFYNYFTITSEKNTSVLSLAIMVHSIDGVEVGTSEDEIENTHNQLVKFGITINQTLDAIQNIKKKWMPD